MFQDIDREDHVKGAMVLLPQFLSTQREIRKIADIEPISQQKADLRVLVESAAARLDGHNFNSLPMEDERYDPDPGTDFEDALSR
jgi:hypothetical protein